MKLSDKIQKNTLQKYLNIIFKYFDFFHIFDKIYIII